MHSKRFELARQSRDPRFDGRFFVGVKTTGIYCRPICPVRIPKIENVTLYPSAAAAAEAGFRPCLRCRPEASPGTPAWIGSSYKVSKALQLIEQGAMDDASVEELATRLTIGPRQLSRLFLRHMGASPVTIAQTRRLHFAKQLIDETGMSMADISFAAGFGSVRRFNDVVKQTYGRTPLQLRNSRRKPVAAGSEIAISVSYRPPFDWRAMLQFLATRAVPGVELVDETSYSRTINIDGNRGEFRLAFATIDTTALLTIRFPDSSRLLTIVEKVRQLFDLRADSDEIERALATDAFLRPVIRRNPGIRVPGCWDGFEITVRAIVGQQVSVKAASTLMSRLSLRHGLLYDNDNADEGAVLNRVFPPAQLLIEADLSGLGITGQRIDAIKAVAAKVVREELAFDGSQSPEEFSRIICEVKGIGPWTADYIALRVLRDPDAFPHGDLILQRAAAIPGKALTAQQLLDMSAAWRPWRAYAVMLLWRHYQQFITAESQQKK